jgi:repressor LexA
MGAYMEKLTDRQQQVFNFIESYIDINGYPPTLQEIAKHIKATGNVGIIRHLTALEKKGYITKRAGNSRGIVISRRGKAQSVSLPIVGAVRAGAPQLAVEEIEGYFSVDSSIVKSGESFLLRVKGDSMIEAHIIEGDLAVIRPQHTADNRDIVVAMVDGEATLKTFYQGKDHIRLQPENPNMQPILIHEGEAEVIIIGKVTGTCRRYE